MPLHGTTTHGRCLQVRPPGPGRRPSRKHCHRQLWLCSEGFNSEPSHGSSPSKSVGVLQSCGWAAAPFVYFQYRGHGKMGAMGRNPLTAIPLAALSLQPECTACGEEKLCSWEGRAEAEKARPVKPKGIGPELGRDAWEEHKVKQWPFISLDVCLPQALSIDSTEEGTTELPLSWKTAQCQERQLLFQTCAFPLYAKLGL